MYWISGNKKYYFTVSYSFISGFVPLRFISILLLCPKYEENTGTCFEVIVQWYLLKLQRLINKRGAAYHGSESCAEIELLKTSNSLNPDFFKTYFKKGSHFLGNNDLFVNRSKTTTNSVKRIIYTRSSKIYKIYKIH